MIARAPSASGGPKAEPEPLPLNILYEDPDLIVINKEAGMVVHPAPGNIHGTLVNAILHHLQGVEKGARGKADDRGATQAYLNKYVEERPKESTKQMGLYQRPGIVHRLDKGTSGVMVIAKNEVAHRELSNQFKNRKVEKTYQALVFGRFPRNEGTISLAIGRDQGHRRKFSSRTRHGREAVTHYKVHRRYEGVVHLILKPETGRTHQLRVHLSESHHPIVGDTLYGAKSFLSSLKDESVHEHLSQVGRPLLHAERLGFFHPRTGKKMIFDAPLPDDFRMALEILK